MRKKYIFLILIVLGIIYILFFIRGNEDTWICENEQWIKHGNPKESQPTAGCGDSQLKDNSLSELEARVIAEKSCIKGGEVLTIGTYNKNSKTWWYDANLNATREGCNSSCVVSEETKTAKINWQCTGLKDPVICAMDAKECLDGSYVGRSGSNCEFVCPQ